MTDTSKIPPKAAKTETLGGTDMTFHPIDPATWERKEYFDHYWRDVRCGYGMTVSLDITPLRKAVRERGIPLYPALLYLTARVINDHREFRYAHDGAGVLGYYDWLHPAYTVFHKEDETFSNLWCEYDPLFPTFLENYRRVEGEFGGLPGFSPQGEHPGNTFPFSSIPWQRFTEFHLDFYGDGSYLTPIFTAGRYFEEGGRVLLPMAVQVHHAVCDGFHTCRLLSEMEGLAQHPEEWV